MATQSNEGPTVGSRRHGAWLFLSKSPLRCPSLVPTITHFPLTPALAQRTTFNPTLLTRWQFFFFLFLIYWGGGPDILTPSHPSLGSLAVMSVSGDLCWPLGSSSLPLNIHGDLPKVSGTFYGGLLRIFRLCLLCMLMHQLKHLRSVISLLTYYFCNLLRSNMTHYNSPIPQPPLFFCFVFLTIVF